MNDQTIKIVTFFVVIGLLLSSCMPITYDTAVPGQGGAAVVGASKLCSLCDSPPRGCTIFTVSQGDRVFFGGNGDWINFDGNYYWVDPGDVALYGPTGYAAIYFGRPDNVQQGFNEKGLAYDSNGLPPAPVSSHPGRQPAYGGHTSYPIQILRACGTVEDVIAWVQEHRWHESMHYQMHFADATGDAVVISAGPDGKVAFTRKPASDGFLVSTNFNLANPGNGAYPCWRYERARDILQEIDSEEELTAERAASVLDAVHVESATVWTIMSVVGDLPRGLVYVYLFHQFDAPIVLNIKEEIARVPDPGPLRDLFPAETVRRADQAYQRLITRSTRCNAVGLTWLGLVIVSLVVWFFIAGSKRRRLSLWTLVVMVFGPVGLLVWLIVARGRQQHILEEVIGDLPPYVVGMVAAYLMLVLISGISQNALVQLLAFYSIPLIIGLFLYQGPLLAQVTRNGYGRTLWRRLPGVLVSTNLALAGLFTVGTPLIKAHLNHCGFSTLTALSWWAIIVLGTLGSGLLLYVYYVWAIRRGFTAWTALLGDTGDDIAMVSSPSWRRLWLWILLSFVVLVAGIGAGVVGSALAEGIR
jgi:hypothetical protein